MALSMNKKIMAILFAMLMSATMFAGMATVTADERAFEDDSYCDKYKPLLDLSENQIKNGKIQLTEKQIKQLNTITDQLHEELKNHVENILDEILSEDGVLDLNVLESVSRKYLEYLDSYVGPNVRYCGGYDGNYIIPNNDDNHNVTSSKSSTTITYKPINAGTSHDFMANGYHWTQTTIGLNTVNSNSNAYSGAIGAFTDSYIGGCTAEAMQYIRFHLDSQSVIQVDAKISYMGSGLAIGIAAFAGTYKSRSNWMPFEDSWNRWQNNYHNSEIDSPWDLEDIIPIIIDIGCLYNPGITELDELIDTIDLMNNFFSLLYAIDGYLNTGDAEIHHVAFSFTADAGWHEVYAGLRAQSSSFITGTGIGIALGQVESIKITQTTI
jgi:hypothetical protein